ncbi:MAG TPA: TetR/AcrR family transcriptional regulator [Solirubrobacteraceae bacterium]|nr:TetR/AcrR family transcriptional regulator [Solirubrobacteraceae bacterium]
MTDDDKVGASTGARAPRVRGPRLRRSILRRAGELASLEGLDRVSLGRLAAAMEMSKSGLYAYFTSKEDLQLATIDCAWLIFAEHVLDPGDDGLEALLERWVAYYEREVFPGGCLFITAGMEFANRDGPVHDALAAAIDRQHAALERAILRAVDGGRLPASTDPAQLGFELHAILAAGNQRFRMSRDPAAFAWARAAIARMLAAPRG